MKRIKLRIWIVNAGVCLLSAAAFAGETPFDKMQLKGRTDKENPIAYKVGEPIVFTLRTDGLDAYRAEMADGVAPVSGEALMKFGLPIWLGTDDYDSAVFELFCED